jgi:transposase
MIRLTDEQWERIRNHFPEEHIPDGRPGRKPIATRHVLEAVLWILNTGAQWHMLPQSYPNYKTVHRRFQTWCRGEVLRRVLTDITNELRDRGALNEQECFIDAIGETIIVLLTIERRQVHQRVLNPPFADHSGLGPRCVVFGHCPRDQVPDFTLLAVVDNCRVWCSRVVGCQSAP